MTPRPKMKKLHTPGLTGYTVSEWVRTYRKIHPRSRAPRPVIAWRNTRSKRNYRCLVCGEIGGGYSARWPRTRRSKDWETAHMTTHFGVARAPPVTPAPPETTALRARKARNYARIRKRLRRALSRAIRAEERDARGSWRYGGLRRVREGPADVRRARLKDAARRADAARTRMIAKRLQRLGLGAVADMDDQVIRLIPPGAPPREFFIVDISGPANPVRILTNRRLPHGLRFVAGLHLRQRPEINRRPYLIGAIADGGQVRIARYTPVPGARARQGDVYLAPATEPPKGRITLAAPVDPRRSHIAALGVVDSFTDRATHVAAALIHPEHPPLRLPGGWWRVVAIPGGGD